MNIDLIGSALFWGIISAISLPIGAILGLILKPGRKITSALMAFGAGALLFALTIELFSEMLHYGKEHGKEIILITIISAVVGGLLFDFLNQILNNKGAFLKSLSETTKHLRKVKLVMAKNLINTLSKVNILQSLPPEEIAQIIPHMKKETFEKGEIIFREDELGSNLYFIVSGQVEILRKGDKDKQKQISILKENETFGEMALLSHKPRNATARALSKTQVLKALHSDFDALLSESEKLQASVQKLFNKRADNLSVVAEDYHADEWKNACLKHFQGIRIVLTENEIAGQRKTAVSGHGAAMAIWLGILLDGIPESMIIGMLTKSITGISLALIAGVFLANLPEAMSSAIGMQKGGMKFWKILWMWASLCLLTGIGAVIGVLIFPSNPSGTAFYWIAGIEGLAAGAMLTMIAETMLPEAFEQGGAIVGFSTLMGFLTALFIKAL